MAVDGVGVFYREAGPKHAPTIVLLHGFPSSSREFDALIPWLATRYHLIAPDFPGFGQSDAPPPLSYACTFDSLAKTTNNLLQQLKINKYILYLHDYGGPVGFRIILVHPERVQARIIQNANAYKEGLRPPQVVRPQLRRSKVRNSAVRSGGHHSSNAGLNAGRALMRQTRYTKIQRLLFALRISFIGCLRRRTCSPRLALRKACPKFN